MFRRFRRFKYLILGILKNEFPRKNLIDLIEYATLNSLNYSLYTPRVCYLSWKTPLLTRTHFQTFKKYIQTHDDIKFYFFDDLRQEQWMHKFYGGSPIYDIYARTIYGALKSDIFRYCLLLKNGGIFLSINRIINFKLSELTDYNSYIISFERNKFERVNESIKIPNDFLKKSVVQYALVSPPQHPILQTAIDYIVGHANSFENIEYEPVKEAIWNFSGPYLLTRAVDYCLDNVSNLKVSFAGFDYFGTATIPMGSEFRYAIEPSYLGVKKGKILERKTV